MSDESVYRWKMVIDDMYETFYAHDDKVFVNQAKERIFNYYFKNDKILLDNFTSINKETVDITITRENTEGDEDEADSVANDLAGAMSEEG